MDDMEYLEGRDGGTVDARDADTIDRAIREEVARTAKSWGIICEGLVLVEDRRLWRVVEPCDGGPPYESFRDYVERVVREPITTVRAPMQLKRATDRLGLDFGKVSRLRLTHAQDLVRVVEAHGGDPPPGLVESLVERSVAARTRKELAEFKQTVATTLESRGVEASTFFRVRATVSQASLWKEILAATVEGLSKSLGRPASEAEALDVVMIAWWKSMQNGGRIFHENEI